MSVYPVHHPPVVVVCTVHVAAAVEGLLQGLDVALAGRHQQPQYLGTMYMSPVVSSHTRWAHLDTFPLILILPGVLPTPARHVRRQLGVKCVKTVHLDKLLAKPENKVSESDSVYNICRVFIRCPDLTPLTELPTVSRLGDQVANPARPGMTVSTTPLTPDLAGSPTWSTGGKHISDD